MPLFLPRLLLHLAFLSSLSTRQALKPEWPGDRGVGRSYHSLSLPPVKLYTVLWKSEMLRAKWKLLIPLYRVTKQTFVDDLNSRLQFTGMDIITNSIIYFILYLLSLISLLFSFPITQPPHLHLPLYPRYLRTNKHLPPPPPPASSDTRNCL